MEVVTVNDGSPDRSGAILDEHARRDPRVRVRHLPDNLGLGQARNAGLEDARGAYVWFVDGDDWLPPGSLPAVVERLRAQSPDVLVIDHAEVHARGRVIPSRPPGQLRRLAGPLRPEDRPRLLRTAQSACTKIVRRAFLDEHKLRFATGWYEDSSFSHPVLLAAERIEVLDRVCYLYRQHRDGITHTPSDRHFEVFDQYRVLFDWLDGCALPAAEALRPDLFRLMIDHYLVIAGHPHRVPPQRRREFFARAAADYRARLPAAGYPLPPRLGRLRHALVRADAYRLYAALRLAHLPIRRLRWLWRTATARAPRAQQEPDPWPAP